VYATASYASVLPIWDISSGWLGDITSYCRVHGWTDVSLYLTHTHLSNSHFHIPTGRLAPRLRGVQDDGMLPRRGMNATPLPRLPTLYWFHTRTCLALTAFYATLLYRAYLPPYQANTIGRGRDAAPVRACMSQHGRIV